MTHRGPSVVLAALVGLATLAPAAMTLAHQAPGVERAGEAPGAPRWAESRDPAATWATPGEDRLAWLVIALIGLAAAPSRRRILASLAVLALSVLAFETGVHSVHHLGDEAGASQCSVASASSHLAGTPEEAPALRVPVLTATETRSFQIAPMASAPFRSDATRGPPAPLSA